MVEDARPTGPASAEEQAEARSAAANGVGRSPERRHGMTLDEVRALKAQPTAEDIAWAEEVVADYRSTGASGQDDLPTH